MPSGLPASAAQDLKTRRAARKQRELIESTAVAARTTAVLDEIASHPLNPRSDDLGDLSDMATSIKTLGVLEPLVVTTREAHLATYPDHAASIGTAKYVVVAGHRRRPAARLAGLDEVPIEVRPDLSKDGLDLEVFAVENLHRAGLKPLHEAHLYERLMKLGRSQRAIAERNGISQSHVSKRLSLLTLAEPIRVAIADEVLTVAEALELAKLSTADDQIAAWKLMTSGSLHVADAVARQRERAAVAARVAESHQRATKEGLSVVDPATSWGGVLDDRRLSTDAEVAKARTSGHLAAVVDRDGFLHYVTTASPQVTPATVGASTAVTDRPNIPAQQHDAAVQGDADRGRGDARERRSATQARAEACARLATRKVVVAETLRRITAAAVNLGLDSRAQKLACQWLRGANIGPETSDPAVFAATALDSTNDLATRLAYAMALAADEIHTQRSNDPWDTRAVAHVRRLMADAEYSPTPWERRRLETAEAVAST